MWFSKKFKHIEGKGIYLGKWEPKDEFGRSLSMVFDLYAAPQNLFTHDARQLLVPFNKLYEVLDQRNLADAENDKPTLMFSTYETLASHLRKGEYKGQWFLPTEDILIYMLKNAYKGDLRNVFVRADEYHINRDGAHRYHCLDKNPTYEQTDTYAISPHDASHIQMFMADKREERASVHLVRAELRS